jgi:hypothetical protein
LATGKSSSLRNREDTAAQANSDVSGDNHHQLDDLSAKKEVAKISIQLNRFRLHVNVTPFIHNNSPHGSCNLASNRYEMVGSDSVVAYRPIKILYALHHHFDLLDFAGPYETLSHARIPAGENNPRAFEYTVTGASPQVETDQGTTVGTTLLWEEAMDRLVE